MEYRERYCSRCGFRTLHQHTTWFEGPQQFGGLLRSTVGYFGCFYPVAFAVAAVTLPLWLPAVVVNYLRPFCCEECGRRNWRLGGRSIQHFEFQSDGPEYEYDTIRLVRQVPVADVDDLTRRIGEIARAIRREGRRFRLYSQFHSLRSPSRTHAIRTRWPLGNVGWFVKWSEIEWGFGRKPSDPTNEVVLFNWSRSLVAHIHFVRAGNEATCPGLVVEAGVRTDQITHPRGDRTERLERLFSRLIEIVRPDSGCVRLAGQPNDDEANLPGAGWMTYLARPASAPPLAVPLPAAAVPFADGVKIVAAPGPAPERYETAAAAVAAVRAAIAGPTPPAGQPASDAAAGMGAG